MSEPRDGTQTRARTSVPPPTPPSALRPSWAQIVITLACTIVVVPIVAGIATALPFGHPEGLWGSRILLALVSPGLSVAEWIAPFMSDKGGWDFRPVYIMFFADLAYWFIWIAGFVFWADRRWRRKRAERTNSQLIVAHAGEPGGGDDV